MKYHPCKPYIAIDATALFKKHKTGVEWYVLQLLKYLSKEWQETDPPIVLFVSKNSAETHHNGSLHVKNTNWYLKPLKGRFFWTQYHWLKFLRRYPPIVLFSPSYVAPRFLPKNIRTVTVVHGLEGEYFPEFKTVGQILSEYFLVKPALCRDTKFCVSTLVAVSEHTKQDLNRFYGIPLAKIKTVLSGSGTLNDGFSHNSKKDKKNINFLFLGGSNERKNLELAIRIFTRIRVETHCNASLHIAGTIKNKKIKKILALRKDIIQLGYVSEKEKNTLLKSAHFLLYPSLYEGFGFPVLEAQAYGAVPIVLKNSGLDEVGGKGIIEFDVAREDESIENIVNYLDNPKKYKDIQQAGISNVQQYSWQTCAQEIRKILLNLEN